MGTAAMAGRRKSEVGDMKTGWKSRRTWGRSVGRHSLQVGPPHCATHLVCSECRLHMQYKSASPAPFAT